MTFKQERNGSMEHHSQDTTNQSPLTLPRNSSTNYGALSGSTVLDIANDDGVEHMNVIHDESGRDSDYRSWSSPSSDSSNETGSTNQIKGVSGDNYCGLNGVTVDLTAGNSSQENDGGKSDDGDDEEEEEEEEEEDTSLNLRKLTRNQYIGIGEVFTGIEMVGVLFLIMAALYSVTSPLWGRLADHVAILVLVTWLVERKCVRKVDKITIIEVDDVTEKTPLLSTADSDDVMRSYPPGSVFNGSSSV
ncbi:hypothetical protein MAR_032117 [Mya arenaria]|uniref:Uncharacterized protein n=1 Tax=Mya arenaria TaxID=6604 RepID=A0ABY7F5Q0_MYAAR|nr:hypothetical protein MAR_032117 [Mya arenaria]